VKALLEAVPNLALLETVDSAKLASKLDSTGGRALGGGDGARGRVAGWVCCLPMSVGPCGELRRIGHR
jgi:hypothetical protein